MIKSEDIRSILSSEERSLEIKLKAVKRNVLVTSSREVEAIISWIIDTYNTEEDGKKIQKILENFDLLLLNNGASIISYKILSILIKFCKENANNIPKFNFLRVIIETILKLPSMKTYLKQNDKDLTDLLKILLGNVNDDDLITLLISFLYTITNKEKAISNFIKKSVLAMAKFSKIKSSDNLSEAVKAIFFKKYVVGFKLTLEFCFESSESKSMRHVALLKSLNSCLQSELEMESKIGLIQLIFDAAVDSDEVGDTEILRFAVFIAHLLGINQLIQYPEPILNYDNVSSIVVVENDFAIENLKILNAVLESMGKLSVNLSLEIGKQPALQWFRAVANIILKGDGFGATQMATLSSLIKIDSSIIEPYMSKLFIKIFSREEDIISEEYQLAYQQFLTSTMNIFTRLQRVNKLISSILVGISSLSSSIAVDKLLPASFQNSLSAITTLLPSAHSLGLIDELLNHLNTCIDGYEDGILNTRLLESVSILLNCILSSSRLLCYSLPRKTIQLFIQHINTCKQLLTRFGTAILTRKHDRSVMQLFLRICYVWGEMNTLVSVYGSVEAPCFSSDVAPTDLSTTLSFLTPDQWSVINERIANFGDDLCNRLLTKLLVQKIRISNLCGIHSEVTAKYLLERHKSSGSGVCGVNVESVMSPEEFSIILDSLPQQKSKAFIQILFESNKENRDVVDRWAQNNVLLENNKFVETMFEVMINDMVRGVDVTSVTESLQPLYREVVRVTNNCTSDSHCLSDVTSLCSCLNQVFTSSHTDSDSLPISDHSVLANIASLCHFPFDHIANLNDNAFVITTAMLVLFKQESILPIFERLLFLTKNPEKCFNIGLFIEWIVKNIDKRNVRGLIIEQLVVKCTSSDLGMKQFKAFVKSLKTQSTLSSVLSLEVQVLLQNSIRKCWRKGNDADTVKANDTIAKQRRRLVKGLHFSLQSAVDSSCTDYILLDAYAIELLRVEREGNVDAIVALNFTGFLKKAVDGLKSGTVVEGDNVESQSCLNFVTTVLKCATALRKATKNEDLVFNIWQQLKAENCPSLWQHFCLAASDEEFIKIMQDLLVNVQAGLTPPDHEQIKWENNYLFNNSLRPMFIKLAEDKSNGIWRDHYVEIWKLFIENSKAGKLKCCCDAVSKLISKPLNIIPNTSSTESLLVWLNFLHFIATRKNIPMRCELEDYLLDVLLAVPIPCTGNAFYELFTGQVDILSALISKQKIPIIRKVALIFQVFQRLLHWLLQQSDTNNKLDADQITSRALAAFHLEKWVGLFVRRKEEFRTFALFIVEVIHSIANVTIYPPVKIHLDNIVFSLLDVSDEQTFKFLLRTLPPGPQQVFTNLHSEFQKFHKYKGKI